MDCQDWDPVVLSKKEKVKGPSNVKKLVEEDGDVKKPKMFTVEFGRQISRLRTEKGLTRKQLAQKMNKPESLLESIENGKELYSGPLLAQLKKILGNEIKV